MTTVNVRRLVAGAAIVIGMHGCKSGTEAISADLEGRVEAVEMLSTQTRVLLGGVSSGSIEGPDQRIVWVTPQTRIDVLQRGGEFSAGTASDIVVGRRLSVLTNGAEMRSLPPQYQAVRISILP